MIDELVVKQILKKLSKGNYPAFSSEAQLRDSFAIELSRTFPDCVVYPEYTQPVPVGWRCYENLLHFDLLVDDLKSNETILFEFKYKTVKSEFDLRKFSLFLRDNSDNTNGRYAVWRDIYRVESFVNEKKITKGFIVFITNNSSYYSIPKPGSLAFEYSIAPGMHKAGNKNWLLKPGKTVKGTSSIAEIYRKDQQPLEIKNDYFFDYEDYSTLVSSDHKKHIFKQLVVPVHSKDYDQYIETILRKIGKENFINYYGIFVEKGYKNCKQQLIDDGFSPNSASTIVTNINKISKEGIVFEAINNIISSSKVDISIRSKASSLANELFKNNSSIMKD